MRIPPRQHDDGFTLIEVLVVVLIISVLAAIALPSFVEQRGRAHDTDAKLAARTAQTAFETRYTEKQSYLASLADLRAMEPALGEGVAAAGLTVTSSADSFEVGVTSESGNVFRIVKAADGAVTRSCTTADENGCPATGRW